MCCEDRGPLVSGEGTCSLQLNPDPFEIGLDRRKQRKFEQKEAARRSRNHKGSGVGVWAYRRVGVKILAKMREVESQ